jgi:hypothetical protein
MSEQRWREVLDSVMNLFERLTPMQRQTLLWALTEQYKLCCGIERQGLVECCGDGE